MIVYDLKCKKEHVFEAWFRDSGAYDDQARAGKVVCPVCGSRKVEKVPMAPRISKGAVSKADTAKHQEGAQPVPANAKAVKAMRALRELQTKIEKEFDYVGPRFAEEARRIHYGETDSRNIYGETSNDEAEALQEEGVSFGRIPWPARQDS